MSRWENSHSGGGKDQLLGATDQAHWSGRRLGLSRRIILIQALSPHPSPHSIYNSCSMLPRNQLMWPILGEAPLIGSWQHFSSSPSFLSQIRQQWDSIGFVFCKLNVIWVWNGVIWDDEMNYKAKVRWLGGLLGRAREVSGMTLFGFIHVFGDNAFTTVHGIVVWTIVSKWRWLRSPITAYNGRLEEGDIRMV